MWRSSQPWRKVLNAVVAELIIHKFLIIHKVLSDERLGAKLRVTENRCVLFNLSIYVYIYIYIIYIYHCFRCQLCLYALVINLNCQLPEDRQPA